MGLDIYFKDDLARLLVSVEVASASTASYAEGPLLKAWREGFQAAILAVAQAVGLSLGDLRKLSLPYDTS